MIHQVRGIILSILEWIHRIGRCTDHTNTDTPSAYSLIVSTCEYIDSHKVQGDDEDKYTCSPGDDFFGTDSRHGNG
jgi:hypothetical protein